jgi:hypothetical protein
MMASVVNAIQDCGIQVEHIPGGCTPLCQPVDVGIAKPLKVRVLHKHNLWLTAQADALAKVGFKPPPRAALAGWVVEALEKMEASFVRNSWRHAPYSYF